MSGLPTNPAIVALIGATASGKSSLAMALARKSRAEILSVDSMQVYRGMNIGTAKPSVDEQREIKHHLIDVVDPSESFTAAMFVSRADEIIRDARSRGVTLIVTGGTPMYFKALFDGIFEGPSADAELREKLAADSNDALHARLQTIDPVASQRIHQNDRRRMVRAIEVFELTGQSISSLQTEWVNDARPRHAATWFGLMWEKDELNRRINARVKQMIEAGWVKETRELLDRFGTLSKTASEATGYAEITRYLRGEMSLDDAIEQIKIATRQLARRQMKWFRRFRIVTWLDGSKSVAELSQCI